jgi:hypothetical protein
MALVLGARRGDRFTIGSRWVEMVGRDGDHAVLRRDDGVPFTIGTADGVEIVRRVHVWVGVQSTTQQIRLIFRAPRDIAITRVRSD